MRVKGGTNLAMNRGDSETLTINYTDLNGTKLVAGDTVYFSIKQRVSDVTPIFSKTITEFTPEGKAVVEIESEDTKSKEVKTYVYDVRLVKLDGKVITLVSSSLFSLEHEVTTL